MFENSRDTLVVLQGSKFISL